jgi:hypothetical protein
MSRFNALIASLVLAGLPASAHMAPEGWTYDFFCCSGHDCGQIPDDSVEIMTDGYRVTLDPGDHPMVTEHRVYMVPFETTVAGQKVVRKSKDSHWHICFFPTQETVRCFFTAPMGY